MTTWLELQSRLTAARTILWSDHHSLVVVAEYQLDPVHLSMDTYLEIGTEVRVA
jgi:hypothetical protein